MTFCHGLRLRVSDGKKYTPELSTKLTRVLYKLKGYSDDWIEKRMRGIVIREELTDEWSHRGTQNKRDHAILTAEIFADFHYVR